MLRSSEYVASRVWRRAVAAASAVAAVAAMAAGAAAPAASAGTIVEFCTGNYAGNQFCSRQAQFSLIGIAAQTAYVDAVCVYRATANYDGAPSASGSEYCIPSGGNRVAQAFYGYTGNPTVHNRHSYVVTVGANYERN